MSDFDDIDEALAEVAKAFVEEARELLEDFERFLLELEDGGEASDETVNAIFRSMHSVKGSAGMFGFDDIVDFTHVVENALTKLRNGEIKATPDFVALMLESGDHTKTLVNLASEGIAKVPTEEIEIGQKIHQRIFAVIDPDGHAPTQAVSSESNTKEASQEVDSNVVTEDTDDPAQADAWHISVRFSSGILKSGMDPVPFIAFLNGMGKIQNVVVVDNLPNLENYDPETHYLGYEISFVTKSHEEDIKEVFNFIKEDTTVHLLPPKTKISHFVKLINDLPEDDQRLAEILVASGSVDKSELQSALSRQAAPSDEAKLSDGLVTEKATHKEGSDAAGQKQQQSSAQNKASKKDSKPANKAGGSVRVDAYKLDTLINVVGELVIASAGSNLEAKRIEDESLNESLSLVNRLVHEIRDSALGLRMVEIGASFDRFKRVVRDVSRELDKKIELSISGGDTELDKFMVEQLADPLMHLVRNACDHGLETEDERVAAGKSAVGTVSLNAYHDSGSIVIKVSDDGKGMDRDKILAKAIENGIVREGANLTDNDIFRLVFEAGFSTADSVTNISGRGVGMDVVRSKVESLRGAIDVDSKLGSGSSFTMRLPLTLAIIDGFLVRVCNDTFVVPLDMVSECVECAGNIHSDGGGTDYVEYHGGVLPIVRLRNLLQLQGEPAERESVVVVRYAGHIAGLVVDELLGEYQTVIKPLGNLFNKLKWTSGSTILGSGQVGLILDVQSLVNVVLNNEAVTHHVESTESD